MLDQLERYMEDQLLVIRRGLERLEVGIETAQQSRDSAVGADARSRAERQIQRLEIERDEALERVRRFENRDDDDYRTWRQEAQRRRAEAAALIPLVEFPFEVE